MGKMGILGQNSHKNDKFFPYNESIFTKNEKIQKNLSMIKTVSLYNFNLIFMIKNIYL